MSTDSATDTDPGNGAESTSPVENPTTPVPMTDEQKFFFDLKGWILVPSVLTETEIEEMKAEVYDGVKPDYKGKNSDLKQGYQGKLANLLDHPAVVGILNEILTEPPFVGDDHYGFRCENSFIMVRDPGWESTVKGTGLPHVVRPPQQANAMRYQVQGGKIFAGLTRVVWELEEVRAGYGGTSFLSGSHKAHFNYGGRTGTVPTSANRPGRKASTTPWRITAVRRDRCWSSQKASSTRRTTGPIRTTGVARYSTATTRSGRSGTGSTCLTRSSRRCLRSGSPFFAARGNWAVTEIVRMRRTTGRCRPARQPVSNGVATCRITDRCKPDRKVMPIGGAYRRDVGCCTRTHK